MSSSSTSTTIRASFLGSPSLHPKVRLTVEAPASQFLNGCDLHTFVALNDLLFLDANELADHWGDSPSTIDRSKLRNRSRSDATQRNPYKWDVKPSVIDLERPIRATADWVKQQAVLHTVLGTRTEEPEVWELDIQLHSRYQRPVSEGRKTVTLGSGQGEGDVSVFAAWGCPVERNSDDLLPEVRIYDIAYQPNLDYSTWTLELPTGIPAHRSLVDFGTAAVVVACWLWVGRNIWALIGRQKTRAGK